MRADKNYAGMIVYTIGSYDAKKITGNNIYPGWIMIKEDVDIKDFVSN